MSRAKTTASKRKMVGVRIPEDLHASLRNIALTSSVPLQDVIETVLRHYVRVDAAAFHGRGKAGRGAR
jgi:predicted HicB family RNase H-like nuclease